MPHMTTHLPVSELTSAQRRAEAARLLARAVLRRLKQARRGGRSLTEEVAHNRQDGLEVSGEMGLHVSHGPAGERRGAAGDA